MAVQMGNYEWCINVYRIIRSYIADFGDSSNWRPADNAVVFDNRYYIAEKSICRWINENQVEGSRV